jgi:hypothetical protein
MAPVQKKTSFSAVPELTKEEKPKPAVPQEDAPNKGGLFGNTAFGNKPLESGVGKSGLFSAKETADESSKEPANAQTSKQAGGSLFDNFASK